MSDAQHLNRILDDCLDRVLFRGESVESCLARHPQQAAELEPLLRAAVLTRQALASQPQPEWKAQARLRLGQALEQHRRLAGRRGWARGLWRSPRWAAAAAAALVVALLAGAGSGTVAASASSVPNEPLYGVKRKAEAVRLFFSLGEDSKATVYADLADRRLVEMASMTEAGRPREVELLGQDLQGHLERIKALAGGGGQAQGAPTQPQIGSRGDQGPKAKPPLPPGPAVSPAPGAPPGDGALARRAEVLAAMMERSIERRRRQLELALANAPPELRPRIKQAIAQSEEQHKRALEEMKRRASEAGREKREGTPPGEEQRRERPPEPRKPREGTPPRDGTPRSLNPPPARVPMPQGASDRRAAPAYAEEGAPGRR